MNLEIAKKRISQTQKKLQTVNTHPTAGRQKLTVGIFLCIVFFGMAFFLTSKWWMPANTDIQHTVPGTSYDFSSFSTVTIKRWDLDKSQNLLEVEFEKDDGVTGSEYSYAINAYGNESTNQIPLEISYSSESFFVVQIPNASSYQEIILLVRLDMDKQSFKQNFYCDLAQAHETSIQKDKSDVEYIKLNLESKADILEAENETLLEQNRSLNEKIEEYNQSIESIQSEQQYQSGEELDRSNARIEEYTSAINAAQKTIQDNEEKIQASQQKADDLRARAAEIS